MIFSHYSNTVIRLNVCIKELKRRHPISAPLSNSSSPVIFWPLHVFLASLSLVFLRIAAGSGEETSVWVCIQTPWSEGESSPDVSSEFLCVAATTSRTSSSSVFSCLLSRLLKLELPPLDLLVWICSSVRGGSELVPSLCFAIALKDGSFSPSAPVDGSFASPHLKFQKEESQGSEGHLLECSVSEEPPWGWSAVPQTVFRLLSSMISVLDAGSGIKPILGSPETHLFVAEIK
ncbi:hypothetical protein F2Q68_00035086 [Brassica cretica]|uniref:Uncharacterized protein n=1 Tax=Brassica cretica TaxID=69181 RepID=A0A8S9H8I9_BRACR|nr:hypothetical protein F2Q68_00035086 [Brassica cretica]